MMKLQHLRFFVAVVEHGGVVKAAERLSVSQPTVSAGLKLLESELGQPLFEPAGTGRRLRPTAKAVEFHKDALEILKKCEAARINFRRKGVQSPTLRIGVLNTIASRHVASFTRALTGSNPELRVQLREGGRSRIQEWLRGGQIDAAWTTIDNARANTHRLWREPFLALVGSGHRFARDRRAQVSYADIEGENFVLRGACEMPRGSLWPESLRLRVVARAERDELALRLVAEGAGLAIAPQSLATDDVVAVPIHELDAIRTIGLRWRNDLGPETLKAALDALSTISA
jgi:DNA-binding transcriptional LysR family regulator